MEIRLRRGTPDPSKFNEDIDLPYELRLKDFELAMQDVYDFFFDVNTSLWRKGLPRFDDMLRPAAMSGIISDMLTGCLARHSRTWWKTDSTMDTPTSSFKGDIQTIPFSQGSTVSRSRAPGSGEVPLTRTVPGSSGCASSSMG